MPNYYDRYQKGFHQEVYDELLQLKNHIYEPLIYNEALLVMQEIIKRIHYNIELLTPRLIKVGYKFIKNSDQNKLSFEENIRSIKDYPVYRMPVSDNLEKIEKLEQLAGHLPLSLKCWFDEIGEVDFIGLFQGDLRIEGPHLDPLYVCSIDTLLHMVSIFVEVGGWEEEPELLLSPDCYHKYGYSGGGSYSILLPCESFDAILLNEPHKTTFINYLRICMRWGGFPGLEKENKLSKEEFHFLTKDLMPF